MSETILTKRGNYGDRKDVEKPAAGEAKPGSERPSGEALKPEGRQPADVKGENRVTPELQPGRSPNG